MPGLFITIEGTDGAGKSSQLRLLGDHFRRSGKTVHTLHFPRVDQPPYGPMIAAFLRGDYGDVGDVHPKLAALLYALDRREAAPELRSRLEAGEAVLLDRYIHSNIAYQCAKLQSGREQDDLAAWIEELEYRHHAIPRPDATLFLDAPLSFTLETLTTERTGDSRAYLNGNKDIHEANHGLQEKVNAVFRRLAERPDSGVVAVDCSAPTGGMASLNEIHARIVACLRQRGVAI